MKASPLLKRLESALQFSFWFAGFVDLNDRFAFRRLTAHGQLDRRRWAVDNVWWVELIDGICGRDSCHDGKNSKHCKFLPVVCVRGRDCPADTHSGLPRRLRGFFLEGKILLYI